MIKKLLCVLGALAGFKYFAAPTLVKLVPLPLPALTINIVAGVIAGCIGIGIIICLFEIFG